MADSFLPGILVSILVCQQFSFLDMNSRLSQLFLKLNFIPPKIVQIGKKNRQSALKFFYSNANYRKL